ncbi:replication protein A 70 kDa DNA-binding subunit [Solenopsis invicta]|uniref:replication protein A 70 kDa DNA-binding subunit n=1 Tax=Solenopsis invicta TaxID=13686 RepID=UPI00193EAC6B|nr:replication protein A 70 kDa DNA-binding subunit [Solenopsis invicta]
MISFRLSAPTPGDYWRPIQSKKEVSLTKRHFKMNGHRKLNDGTDGSTDGTADSTIPTSLDIYTTPIAKLNGRDSGVIKAREIEKSQVKLWNNNRGRGKYFFITLIDASGKISCTAFQDMVDKFFNLIVVGNVYHVSRCHLKKADKRFNTTKNNYELIVHFFTRLEPCHDHYSVPTIWFNFSTINQIKSKKNK